MNSPFKTAMPIFLRILRAKYCCRVVVATFNQFKDKLYAAFGKVIKEKKCDYVLGVKKNQPTLYSDIELMVKDLIVSKVKSDKEKYETAYTVENNRTRYEKRTCYVITDTSWLEQKSNRTDLNNIIAIERIVEENEKKSKEMSYYISSLKTTPEEYLRIIREHWKIESMHWFLDVVMKEDECRIISKNG